MEANPVIINNIKQSTARLLLAIQDGRDNVDETSQYRLDNLCKDVLELRDYIANLIAILRPIPTP